MNICVGVKDILNKSLHYYAMSIDSQASMNE